MNPADNRPADTTPATGQRTARGKLGVCAATAIGLVLGCLLALPVPAHASLFDELPILSSFLSKDRDEADAAAPSDDTGPDEADAAAPDSTTTPASEPDDPDPSASTSSDATSPDATSVQSGYSIAKQVMQQAILEGNTATISLEGKNVTKSDFKAAIDELQHEPRCIHWGSTSYSLVERNGLSYVVDFTLKYRIDEEALATYQADLEWSVNNVVSQVIDPSWSNYDKALALHDWLIDNVTYDQETADSNEPNSMSRTPLGAIAYGKAVCSGYSTAYELLLEAVGIPSDFVYSESMNHSWSTVCLDGTWYYTDVTWDDNGDGMAPSRYYFMVSEATLLRDHSGWPVEHPAPVDQIRPGIVRYDPAVYSLNDIVREAVYSGNGVIYDIHDYWIDGPALDALIHEMNGNGEFWDVPYFEWSWVSSGETGKVLTLTVSR